MQSLSKKDLTLTLNHRQPSRVVVDFGSTPVTGIHVAVVEKLRDYFGFERRPVKVIEPYQMLGEIDDELISAMDIDVIGFSGEKNMFGISNSNWKVHRTVWGQEVLLPGEFNYTTNEKGDLFIHPEGDTSVPPSAMMPKTGYFFDALDRQRQMPVDDLQLKVEDNLEEFGYVTEQDLAYWKDIIDNSDSDSKGIVVNLGGTALGDIALVPAVQLKHPKGIRGVEEWYISTLIREDFVKEVFDRETDIALKNLSKLFGVIGNRVDVAYICGADFGTQNSTFCSPETFARVWLPYYKKVNDWIHTNTGWKTFKHSCGSVMALMDLFIEAGFDIINPVQINAAGMDPVELKKKYGNRIVFWGGGVDTQGVFAFGSPQQVKDQVKRQCDILNKDGGFVFNTVHNVQANVPFENVVAMLEALKELR
jgi:hypothetical protein